MLHVKQFKGGVTVTEKIEMVRLNTRVSADLNKWLDAESLRSGLSKSAIMMMATENYRREKEAFGAMADMGELVAKIESLERTVKRKGLE